MARTRRGRQARGRGGRGRGGRGGGPAEAGVQQQQEVAPAVPDPVAHIPPPAAAAAANRDILVANAVPISSGEDEDEDEDGDADLRAALEQSLATAGAEEEERRRREEEDLQRAIRESLVPAGNQLREAARTVAEAVASSVRGDVEAAAAAMTSAAAAASSAAAAVSNAAARVTTQAAATSRSRSRSRSGSSGERAADACNSSSGAGRGRRGRSRGGRRGGRGRRAAGRRGGGRRGTSWERSSPPTAEAVAGAANMILDSPDAADASVVVVSSDYGESDDGNDSSSSQAYEVSGEDSDGDFPAPRGGRGRRSRAGPSSRGSTYSLDDDKVTIKMRSMFENSLKLHATGQHMQACKAIRTRLYPHQMYALAWMSNRENASNVGVSGGILADDMGLGKTLTVLALIMTNFHDGRPLARPRYDFARRLDKNVLKYLPQKSRFGAETSSFNKNGKGRDDDKDEAAGDRKAPSASFHPVGGLSLAKLMGRKKDTKQKVKSAKYRAEAEVLAKMSAPITPKAGSSSTKAAIARDLAQIDESLLSGDDSPDEFDSMLMDEDKSKGGSLSERLGVKDSDLLNNTNSSNDSPQQQQEKKKQKSDEKAVHHNDGLSDDEEYMNMTEAERMERFRPKLNTDGAVPVISSEDEEEEEVCERESKKRKMNGGGEPSKESKVRRRVQESFEVSSDEEEELPDLEVPEEEDVMKTPKKPSAPELNKDLMGAPELTPEQRKNLLLPPSKPSLKGKRPGATLVVTPASLLTHWIEQIEHHVDRRVDVRVFVHYGQSKAEFSTALADQDVVLTTYGTLSAEFGARAHSPLLGTKWLRVCLDEGHGIKNSNTKAAKAAGMLMAERRWIISGTPIQNNLGELWSLLLWLKFEPYASSRNTFRNDIERPVKNGDPRGVQRLQTVVEAVCLRRTKEDEVNGQPLVKLPKKEVRIKHLEFTQEEKTIYKAYETKGREIIMRFLRRGTLLNNYAHVFAIMMRLRQICCHEELLPVDWRNMREEGAFNEIMELVRQEEEAEAGAVGPDVAQRNKELAEKLRKMLKEGGGSDDLSEECSICLSEFNMPVITPCAHAYCRPCITQVIDSARPPPARCPLCRTDIKKNELVEAAKDDDDEEEGSSSSNRDPFHDITVDVSSTKVNAVLRELKGVSRDFPEEKCVVVSQFTSYLSILQPLLREDKISFVRLDGTMSTKERSEVVAQFQDPSPSSPRVLLLSLRAGGVGLNLTAGNRMYLLDPAWNPATEFQCFDRIHRLGQSKDAQITKFVMKDSIEERMLALQDKKKELISGAFRQRQTEHQRRQQRIQDIRDIFGITSSQQLQRRNEQ